MRIKPSTKIHAMLRIHPQLEEVLEDHDLDVDEVSSKSIRQACSEADLDIDEVLEDLKASLRDSATEGWLSVEEVEEEDDSEDDYEDEEEDDYYDEDDTAVDDGDDVEDEDEDEEEDESWD